MPNFKLSEDEAAKLAAFLLSKPGGELPKSTGDAVRGKKFVQTAGCLNCHTLEQPNLFKAPTLAETLKKDWAKGCKVADFGLTDEQRQTLAEFAKTDCVQVDAR